MPPASLWTPPIPAIVRPAGEDILRPRYLPVTQRERQAVLAALLRSGKLSRTDLANALILKERRCREAGLTITGLAGFGARGADGPTVSFRNSGTDATDATSWTYTSFDIGTAAADRFVVVGCWSGRDSPHTTTLTIGGVSATSLVTVTNGNSRATLFGLTVAAGTTATIVSSTSALETRSVIAVWAVYGLTSTTPVATASGTADPTDLSLAVSEGGCVIGFASDHNSAATCAWTGLDSQGSATAESAATSFFAHRANLNSAASYSVAADFTVGAENMALAVSLR